MPTRYSDTEDYENLQRTVEQRQAPEHAHLAAEQQRGKHSHLTGKEQSRRSLEHSPGPHPDGQAATTGHGVTAFGHEEIEALAYHLWESRGRPAGSPEDDWFRAVKELRTRAIAGKPV